MRQVVALLLGVALAVSTAAADSCGSGFDATDASSVDTEINPPANDETFTEETIPTTTDEPPPPTTDETTTPPPDEGTGGGDCEPGYDPCVPRYPPDVDCADLSEGPYTVTGSDPHGLDRDGDGQGCE